MKKILMAILIFLAMCFSGEAWAEKFFSLRIPPPPSDIDLELERQVPKTFDPLKYTPQQFKENKIGTNALSVMAQSLENFGIKYAQGKKVWVITEKELSPAIKPLVDYCNILYQEKVGAIIIFSELEGLVDGAHQELRNFIISEGQKDSDIVEVLVFTSKDIIPRFKLWEDLGYPAPVLVDFPFWVFYYWDWDKTFHVDPADGKIDSWTGGTDKLEKPVLIHQLSFTPMIGPPEQIAMRHIENYIDYAEGRINMDSSVAMLYDDVGADEGSHILPYAEKAFGKDRVFAFFDSVPPGNLLTGEIYLEELLPVERLWEEIYAHGNVLQFSFARDNETDYNPAVYSADFVASAPKKRFMIVRSCRTMDCQNHQDCVGLSVANSGNVLATVGNGKIGNLLNVAYLYDGIDQSLSMEDSVLHWINLLIERGGIDVVMQWMGAVVYVGMPFIFTTSEPPILEKMTFKVVDKEGTIIGSQFFLEFTTRRKWEVEIKDGVGELTQDFSRDSDPLVIQEDIPQIITEGYFLSRVESSCSSIIRNGENCDVLLVLDKEPQPDLVASWAFDIESIDTGKKYRAKVLIRNEGEIAAGRFHIRIRTVRKGNKEKIIEKTFPLKKVKSLLPGSEKLITFNFPKGVIQAEVLVDSKNSVIENDEKNNVLLKSW